MIVYEEPNEAYVETSQCFTDNEGGACGGSWSH